MDAGGLAPRARQQRAEAPAARWSGVWPIVALVGVAAAVRLPGLGESLWCDEVLYSTHSRISSLASLWSNTISDQPAPLYRIIHFFWRLAVGEHEVVVRLPSVLCGLACVALTWRLARVLCRRQTAYLAALLLGLSPVHVWYSQEATPYSMTLFFLLAATDLWLGLVRDGGSRGRMAAYAALILASVLTHYYAAAFLLPLTVLALRASCPARRWIITANCLAGTAVVLAIGIKFAAGYLVTELGFLRPFTPFELWMLLLHWFPTGNTLWRVSPYSATPAWVFERPLLVICQLFLLTLLALGLAVSWRQQDRASRWFLPLAPATLPAALLVATCLGFDHLYVERYLLLLLPFYLIAVACGVTALPRPWARRLAAAFVIGLSLAAWVMLRVRDDAWTVYKPNPDWRAAARVLQAEAGEDGRVTAFGFTNPSGLKYYLRRQPAAGVIVRRCTQDAFEKEMARRHGGTLCLVRNRFWDGGFETLLQRWRADERLQYLETRTVRSADLYFFRVMSRPVATRRPLDPESAEPPGFFGDGFESGDTGAW